MIPLLYEPELLAGRATFDGADHALPHGLAFVPCDVCAAPVDLAGVGDVWQRPLCEAHGRPALVRANA